MRTTTMALLCSLAACAAPVGGGGGGYDNDGPDAGADGSAANRPCTDMEELTMDLPIAGTSGFTNLPTTCWRLKGKLTISGPAVTSVAKLGDLREVEYLELNNTDLTSFDSLANVDVTREIWIRYNDKLTGIGKLAVRGEATSITIENNPLLENAGGLGEATRVTGLTKIVNNPKLAAVNLGAATRLEGGLEVRENAALKSLDLRALQSVGSVTIANNGELNQITTSSSLGFVQGSLYIENNDKLTTLGQLGTGVQISTNLVVSGNAALSDLGDLQHANRIFGQVTLTSNASLDTTAAHAIGCCVNTGGFSAGNNKNNSCGGNHWCQNTQNCFR